MFHYRSGLKDAVAVRADSARAESRSNERSWRLVVDWPSAEDRHGEKSEAKETEARGKKDYGESEVEREEGCAEAQSDAQAGSSQATCS